MRKWHQVLLFCIIVPLITSCGAAIRGFPDPPRTSNAIYPDPEYLLGKDALTRYNQYDPEKESLKKQLLRNEVIDARMDEIDARFGDFERELYAQGIGFGVGTDWAVLALTTATTIVGGEATKTALGAISTGVVGAKASFDKRALFDKTLPVLIAQMVAQRESIRASIRASESLPVEDYTIYAALSELKRFEFAGSIPGSLQSIAEDAGQKAKAAQDELKDLRKAAYAKTRSGDILRNYWKPDGTNINTVNETKLKEWMDAHGIPAAPGMITMFLSSDVLEEARAKAVRDLGLTGK